MSGKNFIGYEYHDVTVKRSMVSVYTDGYENFGWQLEGTEYAMGTVDSVILKFKRDRKIRNKTELTRLQRNFDACVGGIVALENSKMVKASIVAYAVGIIGTAFMAGSVFTVTSGLIPLCIILAVPAFAGWILPYFLFKSIVKKKTAEVNPLIDQKYDEIYTICEKANSLLDRVE